MSSWPYQMHLHCHDKLARIFRDEINVIYHILIRVTRMSMEEVVNISFDEFKKIIILENMR
jgi:hypothetical protein